MKLLGDEIREAAQRDPEGDPKAIAAGIIEALGHEAIVQAIVIEVQQAQALARRLATRRALNPREKAKLGRPLKQETLPARDRLTQLLRSRFDLGDGTSISFGQASVAEHEIRIELLERMRDGIGQTIARHRQAIAILETTRQHCLDDVRSRQLASAMAQAGALTA